MMPWGDTMLGAARRLPAVQVRLEDARDAAELQVYGRPLARLDLRHGHVFVNAPTGAIATMQRLFPSSRATSDGIAFHVADADGAAQALAAIRRRASVERFGWQLRVASP